MKRSILLILSLIISTNISFSQKAIFLHHSTGGAVYNEGNVADWIASYNTRNGTSYSVTERAYPDSPYPWENYPYDFWNLWVNGGCDSGQSGIECINSLAESYNLIIFKHCFPGAGIEEDTGSPDITSDRKSLENYKLQYRALRTMMDNHPRTQFMVWTLAPLHRNATNAAQAARAREFVNWVKNTWLEEGGISHPNIHIFDFYNIVAESDPTPAHGQVNCLMYDYEGDHDGSDSHPNYAANQVAGPSFAEAIVNCLSSIGSSTTLVESIDISSTSGYYVINSRGGTLQLEATVSPEDATNKSVTWSIIDGSEFAEISTRGLLHALRNGTVRVQATANDDSGVSNYIDIPISNQPVSIESIEIRSEENTNIINTDNGTLHFYAYALPESIRYNDVTWSIVYGGDIITLSSNGLITAITNGTARIKATNNTDSGISATYDIFVFNQIIPVEAIGIGTESGATTIDTLGGTLQLTYNLIPGNATGYAVWSIINGNEFAEISNDGLLHALRNGTVRIQAAASSNPDITNYIDITITNQPVYIEQLEIRAKEETNIINTDNGKLHLYAYALPEIVKYNNVKWSVISGNEVIVLSDSGVVTALTNGVAQVKATDNGSSGFFATFDIFVSNQSIPIESIEITTEGNATTIHTLGGTLQLSTTILPANATDYVIWSITDGEELASVDPNGLLHAHRNGTVRVQAAASQNSEVKDDIEITITNQPVYIEQLEITAEEETNTINTDNGKLHLYAYALPEEVKYDNVTWSVISGNEVIALSDSGVVTALSNGVAQVKATDKTSGISAIFDIITSNQINPIKSIEITSAGNATTIHTQGGTLQLSATILPANATDYVIWSITDGEELASVDPNGLLHAHRNGTVRVQAAASQNSEVKDDIEITITNQPVYIEQLEIKAEEETNTINTDNGKLHLYAYTLPEMVKYSNVTWSVITGNEVIALSDSGVVTALTNGIAQVKATYKTSGISAIFDIFTSNQINPIESIEITTEGNATTIHTQGGTLQLMATILPANATDYIIWSITDGEELASVDPNGLLQAHRNGIVRVQAAASQNSEVKDDIEITITNQPVYIEQIEIRAEEETNIINTDNGTLHLYAYALPEMVKYNNVTWSVISGNETIVLSDSGVVTALANGDAQVKAIDKTSGISAIFDIFTSNQQIAVEQIEIVTEGGITSISTLGGSLQLYANIFPANATGEIEWSIVTGNELAEISSTGLLHALKNGTVRVKATSGDIPEATDLIDITITNQTNTARTWNESDIKLIYNEAEKVYHVKLEKEAENTRLRVYSVTGKLMWADGSGSKFYTLPPQVPGIYILHIENRNQQFIQKIAY